MKRVRFFMGAVLFEKVGRRTGPAWPGALPAPGEDEQGCAAPPGASALSQRPGLCLSAQLGRRRPCALSSAPPSGAGAFAGGLCPSGGAGFRSVGANSPALLLCGVGCGEEQFCCLLDLVPVLPHPPLGSAPSSSAASLQNLFLRKRARYPVGRAEPRP